MEGGQGVNECIATTGVPSEDELLSSPGYPLAEDFEEGPIAVIECVQEIPCNPCEEACPNGCIVVGEPITNLPRFDASECTGCGLCTEICPEVFDLQGDVAVVIADPVPVDAEGKVIESVESCPVEAIRAEE